MTNTKSGKLAAYLCFAAFVFCNSGNASEPTIGTSEVRVPDIAGFVHLTSSTISSHPLGESLTPTCQQESCVVFAEETSGEQMGSSPLQGAPSIIWIQLAFADAEITADEFARMIDRMKDDIETIRVLAGRSMAAARPEALTMYLGGVEFEYVDSSFSVSDESFGDRTFLAIAANGSLSWREDGQIVRDRFDMTFSFAHAGNRGVLITTLSPGKDARWGRQTIETTVEALRLAND